MMIPIQELRGRIERCSAKAASASAEDPSSLLALHIELLATAGFAAGKQRDNQALRDAVDAIENIAETVEKLVLRDPTDTTVSIDEVVQQIGELQKLMGFATGKPDALCEVQQIEDGAAALQAEERVIQESDAAVALEFVGEATAHMEAAEASLLRLADNAGDAGELDAVFRAFHTLKGASGFLTLRQIGALTHAVETLLERVRKGKLKISRSVLDVILETQGVTVRLIKDVEVAAQSFSRPAIYEGLGELIIRLEAAAGSEKSPIVSTHSASRPSSEIKSTEPPAASARPKSSKETRILHSAMTSSDRVVRVTTDRLDALINVVSELVIGQAMVTQDLIALGATNDQRLARDLAHVGKITRGLQELSMSMRMVPIAAVFQRLARLTRDLAREAGKEVEFVQSGADTELDRNVVEEISDPLVHLIRNSIDHGIEMPEERERLGKHRSARVVLKAFHQGGNVVVEISDDGCGLSKDRIIERAKSLGMIKDGQDLSDQQIFQLIFHPGLSTAPRLTAISGRGVGMDIVKKNVDRLRGRIEIESTAGGGTIFTVRLPLTLAVIDGLIVRVGTQRYIVPVSASEESIRPTAAQLSTVQGRGELCQVRDQQLPIIRLHELFHVEPSNFDPAKSLLIVVSDGLDRCCVLVDDVIGQQQVVIKSVGRELGSISGVAGCAILGDGNVSLILDVAGVIASAIH